VVRLFRLAGARYEPVEPDPIRAVWAKVAARDGFALEEVLRGRASVEGWDGNETLLLELAGSLPGHEDPWSTIERVPLRASSAR
jgi:hypothetical protein